MKDFVIDGKKQRVFVLTSNEKRVVYIPLKDLHRVDYDRLTKLSKEEGELMKIMSRTTLDNGMNALAQYENLVQIIDVDGDVGTRLRKPTEAQRISGVSAQDPNATMLALLAKLTEVATGVVAPAAPVEDAVAPAAPALEKKAAPVKKAPAKKK